MNLKTLSKILIGCLITVLPAKTPAQNLITKSERTPLKTIAALDGDLICGLKDTFVKNFRGGISHCYNDSSLEVLKNRILEKNVRSRYSCPVNALLNAYISDIGQFGSPRPNGRPHLGIDIHTTNYGRKPKKPVAILPAVDGIVVSVKKAREKDNLIANQIKVMGTDGKIYAYDHMAKASDYPDTKGIPLTPLGTIVTTKDTLGYMGSTGETALWHLHLSVMDLDVKKQQQLNPVWQELNKKNHDFAKPEGQVNPLDSTKAGPVAKILQNYPIQKGPILPIVTQL